MSGTAIIVFNIVIGMIGMHYYFLSFCYGVKVSVAVSNLVYRKVSLTRL